MLASGTPAQTKKNGQKWWIWWMWNGCHSSFAWQSSWGNLIKESICTQKEIERTSWIFQQVEQVQQMNNLQNTSKYIKIHQNTSKHIKTHQNTSKYIKIHQNTSKYIKIHQNTSKYIKIHQKHQNRSKYIKIHENTWKYMKIHENTWKYMKIHEIHENTWKYMKIHENTWKYMKIHENTWKYMKIHENTSKYIKKHQKTSKNIKIHQKTSKYIKIHQNTSKYIKIHQNTSKYIKIHQNTSKYIKIHQNTSKYIKIHQNTLKSRSPLGRTGLRAFRQGTHHKRQPTTSGCTTCHGQAATYHRCGLFHLTAKHQTKHKQSQTESNRVKQSPNPTYPSHPKWIAGMHAQCPQYRKNHQHWFGIVSETLATVGCNPGAAACVDSPPIGSRTVLAIQWLARDTSFVQARNI